MGLFSGPNPFDGAVGKIVKQFSFFEKKPQQ